MNFQLLGPNPKYMTVRSQLDYSFVRLPSNLPKWRHPFAFPLAMKEHSSSSISSPAFGFLNVLGLGHPNRHIVSLLLEYAFPQGSVHKGSMWRLFSSAHMAVLCVQTSGLQFLRQMLVFLPLSLKICLYVSHNSFFFI